jgi:hypothetical protein
MDGCYEWTLWWAGIIAQLLEMSEISAGCLHDPLLQGATIGQYADACITRVELHHHGTSRMMGEDVRDKWRSEPEGEISRRHNVPCGQSHLASQSTRCLMLSPTRECFD